LKKKFKNLSKKWNHRHVFAWTFKCTPKGFLGHVFDVQKIVKWKVVLDEEKTFISNKFYKKLKIVILNSENVLVNYKYPSRGVIFRIEFIAHKMKFFTTFIELNGSNVFE